MKRHISILMFLLGAFAAVGPVFSETVSKQFILFSNYESTFIDCYGAGSPYETTEELPTTPKVGTIASSYSIYANVKPGYRFLGWYTKKQGWTGTATANTTDPDPFVTTQQITYDQILTAGTSDKGNLLTIVAKYEKIKFNVTFESNDGVPDKINPFEDQTIDSTGILLPTVTRNGWDFTGWKNEKGATFPADTYSGEDFWNNADRAFYAKLTAQWSGQTYSITLDRNGGTGGSCPGEYTVSENPQGLEMTPPTKEGHTIQGWTVSGATGGSPTVAGSPLTLTIPKNTYGHLTLTPTWNADTFTITYKPGSGTPGNEFTAPKKWGEDTALRDKTYDDPKGQYVQDGWNTNEESFEGEPDYGLKAAYTDNASITLYPHWKLNGYKLTIHHKGAYYDGKLLEETALESLVVGTTNLNEILVAVPTNDAAFYGYYSTEDGSTQIYDEHGKCCKVKGVWSEAWAAGGTFEGSADLEVWAKWGPPPEHCTIRAVCDPADGGTVEPASTNVVKGRDVMLTATANTGYSFCCWTNETGDVISAKDQDKFTVTNNATYTAVFTGNVYTVTYYGMDGEPEEQTKPVRFGSPYGEPPQEVTRSGYVLKGWNTHAKGKGDWIAATDIVMTATDQELYAIWESKTEFDVVFVDKDGANGAITNRNVTSGTVISAAPEATKAWKRQYYDLVGWDPPLPQTVGLSDLEFTAVWRSVSDVLDCTNLLFNAVGNWEICMTDHVVGDSCMKLPKSKGDDLLSVTITEAGTLSFNWKVDNAKFAVSTNGQDIWSSDEKSERWAPDNKETIELAGPCELRFYGASIDFINYCLIDNVTWTPKGEEPKYTLTVTSAGNGTVDPTSTNAVKGTLVTISATPDAGYKFEKWSDGSAVNPRQIVVISNATYIATFAALPPATYTVTLNANGGTGGPTSVKVTYGEALPTLGSLPSREGYALTGYFDAVSGGVKYYNADGTSARNWDKTADTELFAQWENDVGELSRILNCDNLRFESTEEGWEKCEDPEICVAPEDPCLKSMNQRATISAMIKGKGKLTFFWSGEYGDRPAVLQLKLGADTLKTLQFGSTFGDKQDWTSCTVDIDTPDVEKDLSFYCAQMGGYLAIDHVTWTPEKKEPEYAATDTPVTGFSRTDGKIGFSFESDGSSTYHILGTNDVTAPWMSWPFVREIKPGETQPVQIDIKADEPKMFYRIRALK